MPALSYPDRPEYAFPGMVATNESKTIVRAVNKSATLNYGYAVTYGDEVGDDGFLDCRAFIDAKKFAGISVLPEEQVPNIDGALDIEQDKSFNLMRKGGIWVVVKTGEVVSSASQTVYVRTAGAPGQLSPTNEAAANVLDYVKWGSKSVVLADGTNVALLIVNLP